MLGVFSGRKRPKRNTVVNAMRVGGKQKGYYAPARVIGNDRHRTLVQFADGTQTWLMPALIKTVRRG